MDSILLKSRYCQLNRSVAISQPLNVVVAAESLKSSCRFGTWLITNNTTFSDSQYLYRWVSWSLIVGMTVPKRWLIQCEGWIGIPSVSCIVEVQTSLRCSGERSLRYKKLVIPQNISKKSSQPGRRHGK